VGRRTVVRRALMAREQLTQRREPLRCPRCGVAFAIVVGAVGPCEPCQLDLQAKARCPTRGASRAEAVRRGMRAARHRRRHVLQRHLPIEGAPPAAARGLVMRVEQVLCSCCETVIGLVLLDRLPLEHERKRASRAAA